MSKLKILLASAGILAMSAVLSLNLGTGSVKSQLEGPPKVFSAFTPSTALLGCCGEKELFVFVFTDVPAGDIAVDLEAPMRPSTAESAGTIWLADASNNDISVARVGIHPTMDTDWLLHHFARRRVQGKILNFAGGTLTIKIRGAVEQFGHNINVGWATADPRWHVSVLLTVN